MLLLLSLVVIFMLATTAVVTVLHNATEAQMKTAIESSANVGLVEVKRTDNGNPIFHGFNWNIRFLENRGTLGDFRVEYPNMTSNGLVSVTIVNVPNSNPHPCCLSGTISLALSTSQNEASKVEKLPGYVTVNPGWHYAVSTTDLTPLLNRGDIVGIGNHVTTIHALLPIAANLIPLTDAYTGPMSSYNSLIFRQPTSVGLDLATPSSKVEDELNRLIRT